ncbi:recombinase family protein [Paenibacillus solisilvae]|uniref:Recombinase family protein n=1 Tax=Paenibacillus solisilvae TaxID=2486751 RepID=A0ABW0VRA4_9BACL
MDKIKVVAYCRVSTSTVEQDNSFESQKSYFQREITKNPEYTLYRIYADKGISGTSLNRREEFSEMLHDAGLDETKINQKKTVFTASSREPRFHKIYVKNTSRFARNVMVIDILRELLKKGVHVYFLDINLVFDSIDKEFMLNLFLNFAQQESIDKSQKVKSGMKESAQKGVIFTNKNLYGYTYSTETRDLTIREDEAEVIRKVFTLYSEGIGIRRILNILEADGIRARSGKPFVASFIKRLLSNEKYMGTLVRNKYETGAIFNKISPVVKDESVWQVFENRVPVIVSKELFEACNKLRSSKVSHVNQKGVYRGVSEYAGKIYCAKCGNTYTRNIDEGRVFFNCGLKKTKGKNACDGLNVSLKVLEDMVDQITADGVIRSFALQKGRVYHELMSRIESLQEHIDTPSDDELQVKTKELADAETKGKTLTRLLLNEQISEEEFTELKKEVDDRQTVLRHEIKELSKTNEHLTREIAVIEDKVKQLESLEVKTDYSREEVFDLITKFTVKEDGSVGYQLGLFSELYAV